MTARKLSQEGAKATGQHSAKLIDCSETQLSSQTREQTGFYLPQQTGNRREEGNKALYNYVEGYNGSLAVLFQQSAKSGI